MKINNIALTAIALGGMVYVSACDNIDENDRFIPIEKPVVPVEEVSKTLLIQEFTGVQCSNCPQGAAALHAIQEAYPDQVIVVGMQPKRDINTRPLNGTDFRTDAAQAMYEKYNPSGFPCAIFNGTETSTVYDSWFSTASSYIGNVADMSIKAECDYDEASRGLTVDYTINVTKDISSNDGFSVMVWIMENDIKGWQLDNGTQVENYTHNHVLRASLNGNNGEAIGSSFSKDDVVVKSASITLDENWKAENCQVVIYVFDSGTYAVEQSVLADVISEKVVEDPHKVPQTLLIQEFTGVQCSNCPQGAAALHSIQEAYPGKVVVVGMQPKRDINTRPLNGTDFRTDEAQAMYNFFKPAGFPCALFNGENASTTYDQWYTIATNALSSQTNMEVNASGSFDNNTREVSVNYSINFTENVDENLNVMVWLMENDIVGSQLDNGTVLDNYVHNHVLRASLNGEWGENIGNSFSNGQRLKGTASMTLGENWVADNCQIVVYVFNESSKVVRQATVANISMPKSE